jgi:hypothetical protein
MKRLALLATMIGALAFGVSTAAATQTFAASIYRSSTYTCAAGATNTSGAKYGAFQATETTGYQLVDASVTVDNLYPYRTYNVSVTEGGHTCLVLSNVASFTTDKGGKAVVHFQFLAHAGETSAWVTIQHTNSSDIARSSAVPINR